MDLERYRAYGRVRRSLGEARAYLLGDQPCEVLCDAAEGLFLARPENGEDVRELEWTAAATLTALVDGGRISEVAAEWLWVRLLSCGPGHGEGRPDFRDVAPPLVAAP